MELLGMIEAAIDTNDWALLLEVANGASYDEIAATRKVSVGSLRVRASRLRASLAVLVA
jgi:DNA-directed RNA polymerase specialized sigma24 family protein